MLALSALAALGCSNWLMENNFMISGRTMDLGLTKQAFGLASLPIGASLQIVRDSNALSTLLRRRRRWRRHTHTRTSTALRAPAEVPSWARTARFGSVGFISEAGFPNATSPRDPTSVSGGLNDQGLSCDEQTLITTLMPARSGNASRDVAVDNFCMFVLSAYSGVAALGADLRSGAVHVWGSAASSGDAGLHHVVRDASGASLVVEYVGGSTQVYDDANDGSSGFGVMTNEPEYPWQVRNMQHLKWKQGLARPAVTMPGTWYPDQRFLRIALVKSAMGAPSSLQQAVVQAQHVLNVVTVPPGDQMGTDSGAGEGMGDHTMFGVIYDHKSAALYWRTIDNHAFQRLRLADLALSKGAAPRFLSLDADNALPWYIDASHAFK